MDAECPSKLACFGGECKNPCDVTHPCGANAICEVVDTLPLRTMMCSCLPGFVGEADIGCHKGKNPLELQGYSGVLWSSLFKHALFLSLLLSLQQQFLYKVLKQIYILDYKPIYIDAPSEQLHLYIF